MKAISLIAPERIETVDIAEPTLGPEDVLIEVCCVGLCGSDLNAYRGRSPMVTYPRVLGHEVGGVVAAVGPKVPSHLEVGARVTLSPYSHCGACPACRTGRTNACVHNQTLGVQRDGALTERVAVGYSKVYPSQTLSVQELALVEPISVGCHATTVGRVSKGDTVAVFGCGAVGLGAIAASAAADATVIAIDIDDAKLSTAAHLGAEHAVNSATDDLKARIDSITNNEGVSVAIEAVGAPQTYQAALEAAASAGRVVCVGYSDKIVELDARLIVKKELEIRGSRNALTEFESVIRMFEQRTRPFTELITKIVPFDETASAFREWAAAPQRVMRIIVSRVAA